MKDPAKKNPEGHPRMLGVAIASGVLTLIMAVLACREAASDRPLQDPITTILFIGLLAIVSVASFRLHLRLRRMSPDERDAYWERFDRAAGRDRRDPPFGGLG